MVWAWAIGTRPSSRPVRWTVGHSSPLAAWKVETSTASADSSEVARACDRAHATKPRAVPDGSRAWNSSARRRSSAKAACLSVSPPSSSSAPSPTARRSAIRSARGRSLRPRVVSCAFTSARSSRPLPARVRTGMSAAWRAATNGSAWALVRISTAWSDQRPSGPRNSRMRRATARASASWSGWRSTTGSGPRSRLASIGSLPPRTAAAVRRICGVLR